MENRHCQCVWMSFRTDASGYTFTIGAAGRNLRKSVKKIAKNGILNVMSEDGKNAVLVICLGLAAGLLLKLFVVDVLHVSGRSMWPALRDGDTLVVNKLAYGLARPYGERLLVQWREPLAGDVVIYLYDNKIVVKRCVATGGEHLAYSSDTVYTLTVGGTRIPLTDAQYQQLKDIDAVPDGYILAVGDNYEESVDSRTYGFVPVRNVLGKVLCR